MNKAIYPGSFDPATNGHVDIIYRASKIVDTLYVGVLENPSKTPLFTSKERVEQLKCLTEGISNVEIVCFSGLLVDFAEKLNVNTIIRGLRATSDFEYEFQMALTNKQLSPDIETLFISASVNLQFLSSSMVREVAMYGGKLDGMVDEIIKKALEDKFKGKRV